MKTSFLIILLSIFAVTSCSQKNVFDEELPSDIALESVATDTCVQNSTANKWIYKTMRLYYYWADSIPSCIKDSMELSPKVFFDKLLYKADRFSWISKNVDSNNETLYGKMLNKGFEYMLFYSDTTMYNLTAEVIYTYPKSSAEKQGIKRGWIFDTIDGCRINVDNYSQLLSVPSSMYEFKHVSKDNNVDTTVINIGEKSLSFNPILKSSVIECDKHKVGYLCYQQFKTDDGDGSEVYKKELLEKFACFKKEGVDNIVLDFRYNPGGDINLCVTLGSLIVPKADTAQVALKIKYNPKLNDAYSSIGLGNIINFDQHLDCYIGDKLENIFILTGPNTASASEDVINMLLPYKKPILIGLTTYGKNYGSQSIISSNENIKWVMQPIMMKIFNSADKSDFDFGFKPDYEIDEKIYLMKEFGDIEEPLLSTALNIISGKTNVKKNKKTAQARVAKSSSKVFFNSLDKHPGVARMKKVDKIVYE